MIKFKFTKIYKKVFKSVKGIECVDRIRFQPYATRNSMPMSFGTNVVVPRMKLFLYLPKYFAMKKLYLLLFGLFLSISVFSQDGPAIKFEVKDHNFGRINEADGKVLFTYKFTNIGEKPLKIEKVIPSCGCTTPDWSKEEIKPGKQGFISATFDPTGRPGLFNKYITVYANTSPNIMMLTFKGEVIPRTETFEDSFPSVSGNLHFIINALNYNSVYNNLKDTVQDLVVYNTSSKPITIKSVSGLNYLKAQTPIIIPVRKEMHIPIHLDATVMSDLGLNLGALKLMTDDEAEPEKIISVVVDLHQYLPHMTDLEIAKATRLDFDTKMHDYGNVKEGETVKYSFKFHNKGKKDLKIYQVKSTCGCTAPDPKKTELKPGESSEIEVTFYSAGKHGRETRDITVFSNDPMNPEMIIQISANVIQHKD